jgi:hypothetical protein
MQEKLMGLSNNLMSSLDKCKRALGESENIVAILESGIAFISMWNPLVAAVFGVLLSSLKIGINHESSKKIRERFDLIIQTIEKIIKRQKDGETNFEAALICPELFRNILIFEDIERAKEHLSFIETLFSSKKMDFDDIAEALRLVNQLSGIEYKILKLIPQNETNWNEILEIKEIHDLYKEKKENLISSFLSLINMNLVVRKLVIRRDGGPELGTINLDDKSEYIKLSSYGKLFLETMKNNTGA